MVVDTQPVHAETIANAGVVDSHWRNPVGNKRVAAVGGHSVAVDFVAEIVIAVAVDMDNKMNNRLESIDRKLVPAMDSKLAKRNLDIVAAAVAVALAAALVLVALAAALALALALVLVELGVPGTVIAAAGAVLAVLRGEKRDPL